MAAGILVRSCNHCRRAVVCSTRLGDGALQAAGIEIIPLEPDQRSDLRREAPGVTLTSFLPPLFGGSDCNVLTFFNH